MSIKEIKPVGGQKTKQKLGKLQSVTQGVGNLVLSDSKDVDAHLKKEIIFRDSSCVGGLPNDCIEESDTSPAVKRDLSDGSLRLNMVKKNQDSSRVPSQFVGYSYYCQLCNSFLKDMKSVFLHVRSEGHVERLEEKYIIRVCSHLPPVSPVQISAISKQVEELFKNHSSHANEQDEARKRVLQELDRLVKPLYPDVSVEVFGSTHMGFALSTSDVNLNVNIENTELSQKDIPNVFTEILRVLQERDRLLYDSIKIGFYSQMKIPRIFFRHMESNLQCDLRVASYAPCQLSSLLKLYGEIDPRVTKLCVAIKYWAKVFQVDDYLKGHYPSIIFVIMMIHYLQQTTPPVLPVLHEICETSDGNDDEDKEGCGDEVGVEPEYFQLADAAKDWKSSNNQSLGELVHGMFRYYVFEFNHSRYAISIRQTKPLLRAERGWGSAKLAVEDPVIIKNNISKASGSDKVYEYLINCFKLMYLHLIQVKRKLSKIVKDIAEGTLEELPAVGEDNEQEEDKDSEAEADDDRESDNDEAQKDHECYKEEAKEEKALLEENETEGVRNLTEEILAESSKDEKRQLGKKARRSQRETARLLKALELVQLENDDEPSSYTFRRVDFNSLLKSFPVACYLCRRARHTAQECPDENVPKLSKNIMFPPPECLQHLSHVLGSYAAEVMLRPEEEEHRREIRDRVLQDINELYPKATLELFGSSANGFGHCNSDLDLCLLMNEKYECEKVEIIEKLGKSLKKKSFYTKVSWISSARVPIIKLSIGKWDVDCDISMENSLALHNTKMLSVYAGIDERVRVLGYTVKCFTKVCDMCDAATGSLSSYAYILMLIHYLQQRGLLPVLQKIPPPPSNQSELIIDGWNCYYYHPKSMNDLLRFRKPQHDQLPIAHLWLDFLIYYSRDFDWKNNVVTIRQTEVLSKFKKLWNSKPMAIEDPFNLDHNLAQAVSARMRTYILMRFQKAVYYHCKPKSWKDIGEVMNYDALCGSFKSPKFFICDKCNKRGHKAVDCPNPELAAQRQNASKKNKAGVKPTKRDEDTDAPSKSIENTDTLNKVQSTSVQDSVSKSESAKPETTPMGQVNKHQPSLQSNRHEMTRSQIRQELIEESGGSLEEMRKMRTQLKAKVHSSEGTPLDKKRLGVLSDLIRKKQREKKHLSNTEEEEKDEDPEEEATPFDPSPPFPPKHTETRSIKKNVNSSNVHSRKNARKKERVTVKVLNSQKPGNQTHIAQGRTTGAQGLLRSEPVMIENTSVRPISLPHSSSPIAVPHTSFPLNVQPQRPHSHMQMGLLPSPSPPQYIPPLLGSPPVNIPLRVHSADSHFIRQSPPTMSMEPYPSSYGHVPVGNCPLLPSPLYRPQWQPPRR